MPILMLKGQKIRAERRDPYEVARRRMVAEQLERRGVRNKRVLEAMKRVPRHEFVATGFEKQAYLDQAFPIGEGQTISQPLMVATMTEILDPQPTARVLEIGTGSGYQTAVLAELVSHVFTVERISSLSIRARKILYKLRYNNVTYRIGDGTLGWPQEAQFNGILVTAGAPVIPAALKQQLAVGGRLIIPVGRAEEQELFLIMRTTQGFEEKRITACRFVKLIGEQGWK